MRSPLRSPAQVEGPQGVLPQPEKDLERPSSTRLEARFPYCREPAYCILSAYCILHIELQDFPQHQLSGSGIAPLEFYHCWEPVRNSAHDKGHEEGGSAYAKAGWSFRSPPGNSRAYTPKTRVCLLSACAFT